MVTDPHTHTQIHRTDYNTLCHSLVCNVINSYKVQSVQAGICGDNLNSLEVSSENFLANHLQVLTTKPTSTAKRENYLKKTHTHKIANAVKVALVIRYKHARKKRRKKGQTELNYNLCSMDLSMDLLIPRRLDSKQCITSLCTAAEHHQVPLGSSVHPCLAP